MIQVGEYNRLRVVKEVDFGLYLDGGEGQEILLPKRFVPQEAKPGDELEVFLYHDSENRLIATTQRPKLSLGQIGLLEVRTVTPQGAFLDWGLMKDIFVPLSQQTARMREGESYMVKVYLDERTGRVAATEKFASALRNDSPTVGIREPVDLQVWQKTDIGYKVIINHRHTGVLHFNEVFRELSYGETIRGFIKRIGPAPDYLIDVMIGAPGHQRVESEREKVLRLLSEHDGYLPFHDKSSPEEIYETFGMSKKTFKMTLGSLYKERLIELTGSGFKRAD